MAPDPSATCATRSAVVAVRKPGHVGGEAASEAAEDEVLHGTAEADELLAAQRVDRPGPPVTVDENVDARRASSAKVHGWVLCGLAASTAHATAPSGPGRSGHWVQGS